MAIIKPTKPTDLIPESFADNGIKNDFSTDKILNGFSSNFDDILQGDNLNYMLDSIGKQLKYLNTVVDFIVATPVGKTIKVNLNNNLDYDNLISDVSDKANVSLNNLDAVGQGIIDNKVDKQDLQVIHCVIENYVNGTSWYRIWSDGWIEQGGRAVVGVDTSVRVTLLRPYTNANYYVNWISCSGTSLSGGGTRAADNLTATTFNIFNGQDVTMTANWYACG